MTGIHGLCLKPAIRQCIDQIILRVYVSDCFQGWSVVEAVLMTTEAPYTRQCIRLPLSSPGDGGPLMR